MQGERERDVLDMFSPAAIKEMEISASIPTRIGTGEPEEVFPVPNCPISYKAVS